MATETEVRTIIDTPALTVWSESGIEYAVWAQGADPAALGCVLVSKPRPFGSGLLCAEVVAASSAAELVEYAELFA